MFVSLSNQNIMHSNILFDILIEKLPQLQARHYRDASTES